MARRYDAVSLDVGGVLVVPDHGLLALALDRCGTTYDRAAFGPAHYEAMAAVDAAASAPEDFTDYLSGFLAAVDVPAADRDRAHAALDEVLVSPVWTQPLPGARAGLRAIADTGIAIGVTSNSDGTIADHLRRHEWLQVGDGPGVRAQVVTDSGVVGVGKPHPAVYEATVAGLGVAPDRILHVGDSVVYDVDGAAACGLGSVHMDPYGRCSSPDHAHVRSLVEVIDLLD